MVEQEGLRIMNNIKELPFNVTDNFLPDSEFWRVYSEMLGPEFPWFVQLPKDSEEAYGNGLYFHHKNSIVQFSHNIVSEFGTSPWVSLVEPIIKALGAKEVIDIRARMLMKTSKVIPLNWHTDKDLDCKTAVYYLNSNNGKTIFKEGSEVESISNRLLSFDSQNTHMGTTCSNTDYRVVINFNYYD